MTLKRSRWPLVCLLIVLVLGVIDRAVSSAQPPPRAAQDEFEPIDQLPPDEKLPAARLLIAAYSVAWILVAWYLWSIWQRIGRVERDIADVSRRLPPASPPSRPPGGGGAR